MGMDSYLFVAHSKKELQSSEYWNNITSDTEERSSLLGEWWYARKFYNAHDYIVKHLLKDEYECGDFVEMDYAMVHKLLEYCCENADYFDTFNTVPKLCELLRHWDEIEDANLHVFYECDW